MAIASTPFTTRPAAPYCRTSPGASWRKCCSTNQGSDIPKRRAVRPIWPRPKTAPGANPVYAGPADLVVDVETPAGDVLAIDSPDLHHRLHKGSGTAGTLTLLRSDRAMTDCRPVSVISVQTVAALGEETGIPVDHRRFRANIYVDLDAASSFAEDTFIGRSLRIGTKAVICVVERDPRCKMITLDPDTAQPSPEILRTVAQAHEGKAGVYAAVLVQGTVHPGDEITLLP